MQGTGYLVPCPLLPGSVLDHSYVRAAAASLLSLKAEGVTLKVVTSVKKQSGPGIVEVCTFNESSISDLQNRLAWELAMKTGLVK